jgi:hypothetical protein
MYGVASAAQSLGRRDQTSNSTPDSAIVSSFTERGAYSLLSMSA